jgi:ketosteroid isomerase-like protein
LGPEQLELWRRVNELWELAARKDDRGIRDALHPDYAGWDMSAPLPHDRDAAVRSASGDSPRLTQYALEPLSVRLYEGNVGVVHYRYEATVELQQGEPTRVAGKWTEIYAKKEQHWLMIAVSGQPNRANGLYGRAAPAA